MDNKGHKKMKNIILVFWIIKEWPHNDDVVMECIRFKSIYSAPLMCTCKNRGGGIRKWCEDNLSNTHLVEFKHYCQGHQKLSGCSELQTLQVYIIK